jgi:FG-GAP-like repeat
LILSSLVAASQVSQGQFMPQKVFTLRGGTVSRFMAKGDFNGDGKLDVLLAGRNASAKPVLVVFLGNGTGGFGVPIVTTIAGVNKAQIALAGDLNGDGIQDAVVTGTDTVTGVTEFGVMLADGTGKFKTARIHPGFSCRTYDTGRLHR